MAPLQVIYTDKSSDLVPAQYAAIFRFYLVIYFNMI